MKKLVTLSVVLLFTMGLFAQAEKAATKTSDQAHPATQQNNTHHDMKDCVMMKNGKMMMMKGGKTMPMTADMKMSNGTTISPKGECTMADGTKMMFKNGDCMDMNGMMKPGNMGKNNMNKMTTEPKKEAATKEQ